jgi:hypothetical protein
MSIHTDVVQGSRLDDFEKVCFCARLLPDSSLAEVQAFRAR